MQQTPNNDLKSLQKLFQQTDAQFIISKQLEILSIVGGIDNLLQISLNVNRNSNNLCQYTQQQIEDLCNLFQSTNQPSPDEDDLFAPTNIVKQEDEFTIYLDSKNDFWHSLLPLRFADKVNDFILRSKWMYALLAPIFVLSVLCRFTPFGLFVLYNYQIIPSSMGCIWILLHLLCYNVSMMKRMLRSFAFWFKIYNWTVAITCYVILTNAALWREGANVMVGSLIVLASASHDASRVKRNIEIVITFGIIALVALFMLFIYFDGKFDAEFKDIPFNVLGDSISLKNICLNATSNLFIFFSKQIFVMMKYKEKASVLSTRATIKWVDDWDEHKSQHIYYAYDLNVHQNNNEQQDCRESPDIIEMSPMSSIHQSVSTPL